MGRAERIDQRPDLDCRLVHLLRIHGHVAVTNQIAHLHGRRELASHAAWQHASVRQKHEVIAQAGNRAPPLVSDDVRTNVDGVLNQQVDPKRDEIPNIAVGNHICEGGRKARLEPLPRVTHTRDFLPHDFELDHLATSSARRSPVASRSRKGSRSKYSRGTRARNSTKSPSFLAKRGIPSRVTSQRSRVEAPSRSMRSTSRSVTCSSSVAIVPCSSNVRERVNRAATSTSRAVSTPLADEPNRNARRTSGRVRSARVSREVSSSMVTPGGYHA